MPDSWGMSTLTAATPPAPADAEPDIAGQLAKIGTLSDDQVSELEQRIRDAFEQADQGDGDFDAMQQCADQLDQVEAEQARRKAPAPKPITAAARAGLAVPVVPADRAPRGVGGKRGGNVVVAASGSAPGWLGMVNFVQPTVNGRKAHAEAEAENARRVAAAQEADAAMTLEADAAALTAARVDPAAIIWQPFVWLREAAEQNPDAPGWAVSCWVNALCGPSAQIQPLPSEQLSATAGVNGMFGHARTYWRVAWGLCEQMAGARHNAMPDPGLAAKPTYRAPECSWFAVTDEALLQALLGLQTEPDLTAVVRNNRLIGDSPIARLASMIVGPGRGDRGMDNGPMAAYGPGSRLETFAAELRGGAPEPADQSVLDGLSPEQLRGLAKLAEATT